MSIEEQDLCARLKREGNTRAEIASITGLSIRQVKSRLSSYAKRQNAPDGQLKAIEASGLDIDRAKHGWRVIQHEDGSKDSVFWKAENDTVESITDEINAATEVAISRIEKSNPYSPTLTRPKQTDTSLYGFLPLFDAHIGLAMPNYGLEESVERLVSASFEAIDAMPQSECIMILNGGDFTHQNDDSNQTPQSRHPLPISANYLDTTDAAIDARIAIIEYASSKFDAVHTKDLRGNHDPATAVIIRAALRQRYKDNSRISVDSDGLEYWHTTFGNTLITSHHGDMRRNSKDMSLGLMQKYRVERGLTTYHEHHTGHLHHVKETRFDIGGIHLCQHGAISRSSNYDESNLYFGDAILQGITYKKTGGRKSTIEVALDQ